MTNVLPKKTCDSESHLTGIEDFYLLWGKPANSEKYTRKVVRNME